MVTGNRIRISAATIPLSINSYLKPGLHTHFGSMKMRTQTLKTEHSRRKMCAIRQARALKQKQSIELDNDKDYIQLGASTGDGPVGP